MIGLKGFMALVVLVASFQSGLAKTGSKGGTPAPAGGGAAQASPPAAVSPASQAPPSGGGAGAAPPSAGTGTGSASPSSGAGAGSASPSSGTGTGSASSSPSAGAGAAGGIKGTASFYTEWSSSAGSCGFIPGKDELIAAVNAQYMPAKCNQCIQVTYEGKSIKVKATDTCPACDSTKLDLSDKAFAQLAPLDKGILQITWSWVPC